MIGGLITGLHLGILLLIVTGTFGLLAVLTSVLVSVVTILITILSAVLIAVVTILSITFALSLRRVLRITLPGLLAIVSPLRIRISWLPTLSVAALSSISRLRIGISLIITPLTAIRIASSGITSHNQTSYLIRVFHTDKITVGRKSVVNVEMVTITEVFVIIFYRSGHLRQCAVTDVVHFLSNFARRTKRAVSLFNSVTDIVIVATPTVAVLWPWFALSSITIIVVIAVRVAATLCSLRAA